MTFDKDQHRQQTLDWYVWLSQQPGFKAHAWSQVQLIAREHRDLHHDLPARLVAAMQARKA